MGTITSCMILLASAGLMAPWKVTMPRRSAGHDDALLLVENKGEHSLSIVNAATRSELARVNLSGITGHEVAASSDGRFAYAPIYGNSGVGAPGTNGRTIDVIDLTSRRLVGEIDLGRPVRPHCAIYGRNGLLYVTAELAQAVYVINPRTRKVVGQISTEQPESHMLAITRDGTRGYTANVGAGTVTALDIKARKPIAVIHVCKVLQRISLSADDRLAFTADQKQPRLAVIDTTANRVKGWITLPGVAFGTRATPDGRWLLATLPDTSQIAVVDLHTMKVARTINVPESPQEILIPPGRHVAYISCDRSRQVAVLNLENWELEAPIHVGRNDDGMAWAR
jgi:DNA-binding beta-propeller fold protein YncE